MCAEFDVGSMALSATLGESDAISSAVLPTALATELPGVEAGASNVGRPARSDAAGRLPRPAN